MSTITVKSALNSNDVALWDKHPDHPTGEIFVAGDEVVEAAETPRVLQALGNGRLEKVVKKTASKSTKTSGSKK